MTIKFAGNTIQPDDPKLPDMLRKKSEIGKTSISKRKTISATMMRDVKAMLREYFDIMDVPDDEDGLIRFVTEKLVNSVITILLWMPVMTDINTQTVH